MVGTSGPLCRLAADPRAGEVFGAINRLDGVKMLALATVITTAALARRELVLPRWLSAAGATPSLALVVSGVGCLALDGALPTPRSCRFRCC